MSDLDPKEWLNQVNRSLLRDDVQPFEAVRRLSDYSASPRVWHRYFAGDFMADVQVTRKGNKRPRRIYATGEGLEDALANLATAVANYLYPVITTPAAKED